MNLIEAAKLKRPFKRPHFSFYLRPEYDLVHFPFTWEDLLAEDWVIEEKEVTITTSQFNEARKRTGERLSKTRQEVVHICDFIDTLQKELGL